MDLKRVQFLKQTQSIKNSVCYWMSRDQRIEDNWALLYAQDIALTYKCKLYVFFNIVKSYLDADSRHYNFMLDGLKEVEKDLKKKNIPFILLTGDPVENIPEIINKNKTSILITDFNPLKISQQWLRDITNKIDINIHQVDAHNIVPCWVTSQKQEYAAYTIRPKINKLLPEFLTSIPELDNHYCNEEADFVVNKWDEIINFLEISKKDKIKWLKSGSKEAKKTLNQFIEHKLENYDELRNNPNFDGASNLSPYLHFGQISAQRVALEVSQSEHSSKEAFLEQLIVRRELADNFCYYNTNYDNFEGLPAWAKDSLIKHKEDFRQYIYTLKEFEAAKTHDGLWNAAQLEMVRKNKMHGYLRMYWAKKILEWSPSPELALEWANYLNNKYELDGRDPNGYVGVAWSIGAVHDRAWADRPVTGKVRYMSHDRMKLKFNISQYIDYVDKLKDE